MTSSLLFILYIFMVILIFISCGDAEKVLSTAIPRGWNPSISHKRSFLGGHEIQVTIALSQRNLDQLEAEFWSVSDPKSSNFGRYKSFHEVVDMVAPSQASIDKVVNYFHEKGITNQKISHSKDFMTVAMPISVAESIFQTIYEPYENSKTGDISVGMSGSYFLDEKISPHIDFISRFSRISGLKASATASIDTSKQVPRASSATSNMPFIHYPWADYTSIYVQLILFCPDGSAPTISGNTTVGTFLDCGSIRITFVTLYAISQITGNTLFTAIVDTRTLSATKCSDLTGSCLLIAQANNISTDGAFVAINSNSSLLPVPIPLYVPYIVQAFVHYSDNTTSDTATSNTVVASDVATIDFVIGRYSVSGSQIVQNSNNIQAVVEFEGQSYSPSDLQQFFASYQIPDYSNLVQVVHPENNDPKNPGVEANLDIQIIMGIAQNCTTVLWANNNTNSDVDDHLSWIIDVLNQPTSPLLFSVSYGNSEHDYSLDYVTRTNTEFMKAGLRGITLIYCSMDDGAFRAGGGIEPNLDPTFPASSPYVTSVGGTQFYANLDPSCFTGDKYTCTPEEVVCSIATGAEITGGGGFSNVFSRPSYQDAAVTPYLSSLTGLPGFNSSNRAYPDVSMIARNAPYVLLGKGGIGDGTSASAPFFAGLVTLLNDIRLQRGNGPLGFLNPLIYSLNSTAFRDIVRGNNNCSHLVCHPVGYEAIPGFDAASGRGSPIFEQWVAAVLALPPTTPTTTSSTPSTSSTSSSSTSPSSTSSNSTSSTLTSTSSTLTSTSSTHTPTSSSSFSTATFNPTSTTSAAHIFGTSVFGALSFVILSILF